MDKKKKVLDLIIEQGMLLLYFHEDAAVSIQILQALYNGGARVIEYTNRGETAIENFLQLRKFADKHLQDVQLGVGTIRNKIEATEFINEGANFIVCPGVIKDVADLAQNNNLLWVPGCLTATEIIQADDLGADLIKLFPGSLLGPSYLSAMKDVFPDLLFMPTGGVDTTEENLQGWFSSGASAVGMGSKLVTKYLVDSRDYTALELITKQTLETVRKIKSN